MRAIVVDHDERELDGELAPPPALAGVAEVCVYAVRGHPDGHHRALKLDRGAGIWTRAGALVHYDPRATDMVWAPDGRLWALRASFEIGTAGVHHRLVELDPIQFTPIDEIVVEVPSGGPERLEISPTGQLALITWREQSEWGYVGVDLDARAQSELSFRWRRGARAAPPGFLADAQTIIACHAEGAAWWNDRDTDDPADRPSPGGPRRIGWITTHELSSSSVRETEVVTELPPGWLPEDPYDPRWYQLYGPEPGEPGTFGVWLPDGALERLRLPLPERLVTRPLATARA